MTTDPKSEAVEPSEFQPGSAAARGDAGGTPAALERAAVDLAAIDLGSWFAAVGRDLPWRRTRDPWAILVSEVMLQQTQVSRVAERWPVFLDRFPDPTRCAAASPSEVIELWAGMGYNRRALNLHRAATVVRSDHGGEIPSTLRELLALPGVGPYTARAVLVFAFEQPEAVVDTNVGRILARVVGDRLDSRQVQLLADEALGAHDPWIWNQAILDVGAKFCRPRSYACDSCPLNGVCCWFQSGNPEPDPASASAAVSGRQSTFEGSDRQGRGRLVDALRAGSVDMADVGATMGWSNDPERARRVLQGLLDDGLVTTDGDAVRLPD